MKESTFMDFILDKHDEETVYNILNNVLQMCNMQHVTGIPEKKMERNRVESDNDNSLITVPKNSCLSQFKEKGVGSWAAD